MEALSPGYSTGSRSGRPGRAALLGGALIGLFFVLVWTLLTPSWAFYWCAAAILLGVVPIAVRFVSNPEALLGFMFVFALQFALSFNLVYEWKALPGGPQGLNISLVLLLAGTMWAFWGFQRLSGRRPALPLPHRFVIVCAAFVLTSALSIVNATTRQYAAWGIFYNLSMVTIALAAARLCSTRPGVEAMWRGGLALVVTQSAVLLLQRTLGLNFSMSGEVLDARFETGRYGGTAGMAPANAATLLMVFLFFAVRRFFSKGRTDTTLNTLVVALGGSCLLLSLTRSCWIGFLGGSAYLCWKALREGTIRPSRIMALAAAGLVALAIAWGPVSARLDDNHEGAFQERWQLNFVDLEMIKAHPFLGVGLNNAYDSLSTYVPRWFGPYDWVYLAHNQFLHVAAETGLVGLLPFVAAIWVALRALRRSHGTGDPLLEDTVTVLTASVWALIWGMNLDFYSGMQMYVLLWFVLGASCGVSVLCVQEREVRIASTREPARAA